jgi:NitT/TauT family transport system permease protein
MTSVTGSKEFFKGIPRSRKRKVRRALVVDRRLNLFQVWAYRLLVIAILLALWQYLPNVHFLRSISPVFNPFFVSSPTQVARAVWGLLTGTNGQVSIWPYFLFTLESSVIGTALGIFFGAIVGLILSNDVRARQVFTPFVNFGNSAPLVAVIPVIIVIFGPTKLSSIVIGCMAAFFSVFFNAYAGGRTVPIEMLQNAQLFGATPFTAMYRLRFQFVIAWTFAGLPNAISHSLLAVVTTEVLGGAPGVGRLIEIALGQDDATTTFAILVILAVAGALIVGLADMTRRHVLHWLPDER